MTSQTDDAEAALTQPASPAPTSPDAQTKPAPSLLRKIVQGLLALVLLPVLLVLLLVYALIWVVPGFGYCYERYAVKRGRDRYRPADNSSGSTHQSYVHVPSIDKRIRVQQTLIAAGTTTTTKTSTITSVGDSVTIVIFPGLSASIATVEFIVADAIQYLQSQSLPTIRLVQFEHPGYGYSDAVASDSDSQYFVDDSVMMASIHELLTAVLGADHRIVGWGQSLGGSLATLYATTFPNNVRSLLLVDPPHPNIFDTGAPPSKPMNAASSIYRVTGYFAKAGFIRPLRSLMSRSSGEIREALSVMPQSFQSQIFTASHLATMALEVQGMRAVCQTLKTQFQSGAKSSVPAVLLSATQFSQLYGDVNEQQYRDWYLTGQALYKGHFSDCEQLIFDDRTHVKLCTDGLVQAQQLVTLVPAMPRNLLLQPAVTA